MSPGDQFLMSLDTSFEWLTIRAKPWREALALLAEGKNGSRCVSSSNRTTVPATRIAGACVVRAAAFRGLPRRSMVPSGSTPPASAEMD